MRIFRCPCCEQEVTTPHRALSEAAMARGYDVMRALGWTAKRLLVERRDDLEYISDDFVPWLEQQAAREGEPERPVSAEGGR